MHLAGVVPSLSSHPVKRAWRVGLAALFQGGEPLPRRAQTLILCYLLAIAAAELMTLWQPVVGVGVHLLVLLSCFGLAISGHSQGLSALSLALVVAPLIRILSLSLPLGYFPPLWWYGIVSLPLFATVFLLGRILKLDRHHLGLTLDLSPRQWGIAVLGIPLGLIEYLILQPQASLAQTLDWRGLWLLVLVLLVSTGLLEELIFRGLLQALATRVLGIGIGIGYVSAIFGALHIGHRSVPDVIFVFLVAVVFAEARRRTGTILGVTVAHGLTNIMLFIVCPFILS